MTTPLVLEYDRFSTESPRLLRLIVGCLATGAASAHVMRECIGTLSRLGLVGQPRYVTGFFGRDRAEFIERVGLFASSVALLIGGILLLCRVRSALPLVRIAAITWVATLLWGEATLILRNPTVTTLNWVVAYLGLFSEHTGELMILALTSLPSTRRKLIRDLLPDPRSN